MNEAKHLESVNLAIKLAKDSDCLSNYNSKTVFPKDMANQLRKLSYEDEWKEIIKNEWYNIMLEDNSILQFTDTSYRYIMVPYQTLTLDEFIDEHYSEPEYRNDTDLYIGVTEDYQAFVESCTTNKPPTPIRFDVDYKEDHYCSISHPMCHFHIGIENNSRIPSKKLLTPFAFTAFIIRTFYPKVWKVYVQSNLHEPHLDKFKNKLSDLPNDKWDQLQETLFYIS